MMNLDNLHLNLLEESGFNDVISWVDSERLTVQFAGAGMFTFPLTIEQLSKYLSNKNRRVFSIIIDNIPVGIAEIGNINEGHKSASLCRILIGEASFRGKGIGKAVVRKLQDICFTELKLNRVDLWVYDFNKPAIQCYLNAGFKIEGTARKSTLVNGEYWSAHLMGILKEEWELLKT